MSQVSPNTLNLRELDTVKRPGRRRSVRKPILLIVILMSLGLLSLGGFIAYNSTKSPTASSGDAEVTLIKTKISRHYVLPEDETPALATITDTSKLTSQLFKKAQNGDKVLIYQSNRIVILYRPSIDRVISVGPVAIDPPKGAGSALP